MLDNLLERYRKKDRLALARLLTLAAQGMDLESIQPNQTLASSRIIAITGSAGVGKSTLVGKLIELLRQKSLTVAVLACDPQSPLSGGALLGDRFRMPSKPDDGVFIRSLATAGGQGAVASYLDGMLRLLEGFGFDVILVETVGAGQGDTSVRALADVVLLLLQPETGDDLQWEKAGLLEVSDIVAIQKADLPGAESAEAQVRAILSLSTAGQAVPVLRVSAKTGAGLEELWAAVMACPARRRTAPEEAQVLQLAHQLLTARFDQALQADVPGLREIVTQLQTGALSRSQAAEQLLRLLADGQTLPTAPAE